MHSIMNIFTKEKTDNVQTITTLEIAEMMETEQSKILMKLEGDEKSIYYYDRPAKDYGIAIGA